MFNTAAGLQQLRGSDVGDGLAADPGENVPLQSANDPVGMIVWPVGGVLGEPFPCHHLEAIRRPFDFRGLLGLAVFAGVGSIECVLLLVEN